MLALARRAAREIGQRFAETASPRRTADAGQPGLERTPASMWATLTEIERLVAGLVTEGLTNRELGERMVVSQHTVHLHLRSIFRKLGIRSRVELARATALAAARAEIVEAADDARRRIERDLHDGLQQRLVLLGLEVRRAELSVSPADRELKAELSRVAQGVTETLNDLREISRGAHPAILAEGGLGPGIRAVARRSAVPVKLDVQIDHRLPDRLELAAYCVVSEALANVAKHAKAEMVDVSVRPLRGSLSVTVRDDGVGGADGGGSGLTGLMERVGGARRHDAGRQPAGSRDADSRQAAARQRLTAAVIALSARSAPRATRPAHAARARPRSGRGRTGVSGSRGRR